MDLEQTINELKSLQDLLRSTINHIDRKIDTSLSRVLSYERDKRQELWSDLYYADNLILLCTNLKGKTFNIGKYLKFELSIFSFDLKGKDPVRFELKISNKKLENDLMDKVFSYNDSLCDFLNTKFLEMIASATHDDSIIIVKKSIEHLGLIYDEKTQTYIKYPDFYGNHISEVNNIISSILIQLAILCNDEKFKDVVDKLFENWYNLLKDDNSLKCLSDYYKD